MSNHKAHFRGDLQVDGSIVGPDGQPVGGGSVIRRLAGVDFELAAGFEATDDCPVGYIISEDQLRFFGMVTVAPGTDKNNSPVIPLPSDIVPITYATTQDAGPGIVAAGLDLFNFRNYACVVYYYGNAADDPSTGLYLSPFLLSVGETALDIPGDNVAITLDGVMFELTPEA